jgi:glycosyltransferase involved in cell wall biosynthesis
MKENDARADGAAPLAILFVTLDNFPPFRPAAKAIFSEGLAEAGHRIDWVLQAGTPATEAGDRPYKTGIAYVAPTSSGETRLARIQKHWYDVRNDLRIFSLLKQRNYSLVQIKDKYVGALIAVAAAKLRGVPVFYWLAYPHGEASLYAAANGVARYRFLYRLRGAFQRFVLYRLIMPSCAHVFVQSEQMKLDVAAEGIPLEKMTAVPSSVNLDDMDAAVADEPEAEPLRGKPIVYLGTLLRERRLDFLVRVLARVLPDVPDAHLVFVGGGDMPEDEGMLRREAESLGVAHAMTITGWLPMPSAWAKTRHAAVCVSPYFPTQILLSTSPTKLVEYMALGLPVVANDHPEQSEVVRESGAGVVCPWDEAAFAAAIVRVLRDPAGAAAMGSAGRRYVEGQRTHRAMTNLVAARYRQTLPRLREPVVPASSLSTLRADPRPAELGNRESSL